MEQYLIAFITGLTTGGLSCLAVQGGLLATSLERQLEKDVAAAAKTRAAFPIFLFLVAKLVAYTLLGLLLGALGSVLQLTTLTRAILLIAIGIFMLGNALRMFNIHPIFRYFNIEPPKFITRYIRRTAKEADWFTPVFLGALTVLIPCGVTQAMMAVAISSGSAWQGAGLMFAFVLGTSPVFFGVSYLATQLGSLVEKWFMRFVAIVILVLGLVSVDSGLNLMGVPSVGRFVQQASASDSPQPVTAGDAPEASPNAATTLTLEARNNGYFPKKLVAKADAPITLNIVTDNTQSCARAFVIPDINVETVLPETGTVPIEIPAQKSGYQMFFTCSMGMYTGVIVFQ